MPSVTPYARRVSTSTTIQYNGVTFRRYPDSERSSDRAYYRPHVADRQRGVQSLHQEIWKDANGVDSIPEGFHVHHADHDTENNDPTNLVLIHGSEHASHHANDPARHEAQQRAIQAAIAAAPEWHRSEEGQQWHAEHAKEQWDKRQPDQRTCEQCGEQYETITIQKETRFCSNACKSANRRESGVDDEDRTCEACSSTFRVNRYSKSRSCSRRCAWALRRADATD